MVRYKNFSWRLSMHRASGQDGLTAQHPGCSGCRSSDIGQTHRQRLKRPNYALILVQSATSFYPKPRCRRPTVDMLPLQLLAILTVLASYSPTCWSADIDGKTLRYRSVTIWWFPLLYCSVALWWVDGEGVRRVTEA